MSLLSFIPRRGAVALNFWLVVLIVGVAVLGPVLWHVDPTAMAIAQRFHGMSLVHPLGQDEFGRDVVARLLYGARISLSVAFLAAVLSALAGCLGGVIGGYFSGIWETVILRLADVILSFPPILLALLVAALFGPSIVTLVSVLSVLYAPEFARIAYGETLSVKRTEYIEAMRALGASTPWILFRTLVPNISGPLLVQFSLTISHAIIVEAGLSFLGLGIVPPTPSWGSMIRSARNFAEVNPIGLLWPSLCLIVTIFSVSRLCDALQEQFDPRSSSRKIPLWSPRRIDLLEEDAVVSRQGQEGPLRLSVEKLEVQFATPHGVITPVHDVSLGIAPGEILALVGESGSGKSVTSLSISRLLPWRIANISAGRISLKVDDGILVDTAALDEDAMRPLRGPEIATVFQEPMTSLNPVYTVGDQIIEAILAHDPVSRAEAAGRALEMLHKVGMSAPERRMRQYPHELSGGMRQRALIALALSCRPALLIADEPTTALDVTIQAEILKLINDLQAESGGRMSVLFVTHNLGIVAQIADRIAVMYAGRIVETGPTQDVFAHPRHPYSRRLLDCIPRIGDFERGRRRFATIPGMVPTASEHIPGCAFAPRCAMRKSDCEAGMPPLAATESGQHLSRCHYWRAL